MRQKEGKPELLVQGMGRGSQMTEDERPRGLSDLTHEEWLALVVEYFEDQEAAMKAMKEQAKEAEEKEED